ncbi:Protein of unknown function (DUF3263) [Brevibacterium iodinum ATCC 49514]|uniref:DUF3263 domain-containing protein n=1 Tax=Brevibacterium iodinum ATCC 49514 TaxID=1255616 RepID=A0A2H1HU33_9MICO|nr:DUF3263 domain-containing protein [Brevibacterium iodinum]SMX66427.1 Protein of unknown function (DUF3263) [Brevibacterium iodinum ATCC 49514]SUW13563.1 Protein of uncharacterised function (DUF3263) [Brevibacterium iodinum]
MPPNDDTSELSELEVAVLEFERRWWRYGGAKDHAIRERFDMSATSYFQILNSLLDNPAALASDPMLVKRLRRIRSTRQSERAQARVSR